MVINLLLENGADINKPDKYLLTPLHHAAMRGNVEIVDRLLDNEYIDISKGDIQGSTALHIAATYNHPEIERLLLKAGASVSTKDKEGQNVLHRAAQEGNFRCSEALVESLEQNELEDIIRDQDEDGSTPLILAVGSGDERVVALLLEKNDQNNCLNMPNKQMEYPIHCAARSGCQKSLQLLIEVGSVEVKLKINL